MLARGASVRTAKTAQTTATVQTSATFVGPDVQEIPQQASLELALASRILAKQGVLGPWGHISARHPVHPTTHFLMSSNKSAASVSPSDIQVYRIDTAEPIAPNPPKAFVERHIHSEIYKRFSIDDVSSIVNSHANEIMPFTLASILPFKAATRESAFLGSHAAPVFDLADVAGLHNDCLVRDGKSGAALAMKFDAWAPPPKKEGLFRNSSTKKRHSIATSPPRACVLMRGHGAIIVGKDVVVATVRAVYTRDNAKIITSLHSLIGGIPGLLASEEPHQGVRMLHGSECDLAGAVSIAHTRRPWDLWIEEIIDDLPEARQRYESGGVPNDVDNRRASTFAAAKRTSIDEEFPQTTYRYSSTARDTSSPPHSSTVPATSNVGPKVNTTAVITSAPPPTTDTTVIHPPVIGSSAMPGATTGAAVNGTNTGSQGYADAAAGGASQPLTGLGHAVGSNSTHDGPAGEIVTVDQLTHKDAEAPSAPAAAPPANVAAVDTMTTADSNNTGEMKPIESFATAQSYSTAPVTHKESAASATTVRPGGTTETPQIKDYGSAAPVAAA